MLKRKSIIFTGIALALVTLVSASAFFFTSHAAKAAGPGASTSYTTLADLGPTVLVSDTLSTGSGNTTKELNADKDFEPRVPNQPTVPNQPPTNPPSPAAQALSSAHPGTQGFEGLNHGQQRRANNGNQFSLEPPDQAVCTNGKYILEGVNTALAVYRTDGTLVSGPTALNPFFHLNPEIIRGTPNVFGQFTSDPKCYYDIATNRWFLTILEEDTNPVTGSNAGVRTHTELAVSQTADPTGSWELFSIDTTDDGKQGTPNHPGCPCLGDQPLIGSDLSGFYITTNEFPNAGPGFNGAQVYAISKYGLIRAAAHNSGTLPTVVHLDAAQALTPYGGLSYTLQPAKGIFNFTTENNGTEYFLSSLDFTGTLDNRLAVWGLTNTFSLNLPKPNVNLTFTVVNSETYGQPPDVTQKPGGPTPFKDAFAPTEPLEKLAANDDRMNDVQYNYGLLWGAVNTVVTTGGTPHTGIAYFAVRPTWRSGTLSASVAHQGYVAVQTDSVLYPAVAVNIFGKAVIGFTVAGPNTFPSTGYTTVSSDDHADAVHISGTGVGPEDGFTGYTFGGGTGVARWGDYGASAVAPDGSIYLANEFIGPQGEAQRTLLANWSTFITKINAFDF